MIKTFNEVLSTVKTQGMKTVAVAVAQDEPVLEAINQNTLDPMSRTIVCCHLSIGKRIL